MEVKTVEPERMRNLRLQYWKLFNLLAKILGYVGAAISLMLGIYFSVTLFLLHSQVEIDGNASRDTGSKVLILGLVVVVFVAFVLLARVKPYYPNYLKDAPEKATRNKE